MSILALIVTRIPNCLPAHETSIHFWLWADLVSSSNVFANDSVLSNPMSGHQLIGDERAMNENDSLRSSQSTSCLLLIGRAGSANTPILPIALRNARCMDDRRDLVAMNARTPPASLIPADWTSIRVEGRVLKPEAADTKAYLRPCTHFS